MAGTMFFSLPTSPDGVIAPEGRNNEIVRATFERTGSHAADIAMAPTTRRAMLTDR